MSKKQKILIKYFRYIIIMEEVDTDANANLFSTFLMLPNSTASDSSALSRFQMQANEAVSKYVHKLPNT